MDEIIVPVWIVTAVISLAGLAISYNNLKNARDKDLKREGEDNGSILTDIKYIKDTVSRIEGTLTNEIRRVEGRVEQLQKELIENSKETTKAYESAKSAHHRLDLIEGKEV